MNNVKTTIQIVRDVRRHKRDLIINQNLRIQRNEKQNKNQLIKYMSNTRCKSPCVIDQQRQKHYDRR